MIEVYNNDFYVPVELKTGKVPQTGVWDGHRIQIAAYMLLLEDKGKKTGEGYVKYKGADDKRVLTMNTFLREEVLKLISEVDALINGFTPPIHTDNKNKCRSCPHKDVCYDEAVMTRLINDSRATIL